MFDRHLRDQLDAACERGQEQLIGTNYLAAAATLAGAEATAWDAEDFDTLARLYMPLQEARRQIRLLAGEGVVDRVIATSAADEVDVAAVVADRPHGQLLVAGWGTTVPAALVRRMAVERGLFLETFLAAAYPGGLVAVVPFEGPLPPPVDRSAADLLAALPGGSLVLTAGELPPRASRGSPTTFAAVSAVWERLHAPFLAAAEADPDPMTRMASFRRTIAVDPGCEFAHQHLSTTAANLARQLARQGRRS